MKSSTKHINALDDIKHINCMDVMDYGIIVVWMLSFFARLMHKLNFR
jgi:hypothetical protein